MKQLQCQLPVQQFQWLRQLLRPRWQQCFLLKVLKMQHGNKRRVKLSCAHRTERNHAFVYAQHTTHKCRRTHIWPAPYPLTLPSTCTENPFTKIAHSQHIHTCMRTRCIFVTLTPTHKGCTLATIQTLIHTHTFTQHKYIYWYYTAYTCLNVQLFTPVPVSSTGIGYNCDHIVSVRWQTTQSKGNMGTCHWQVFSCVGHWHVTSVGSDLYHVWWWRVSW